MENWLLKVEHVMKASVKDVMRKGMESYSAANLTAWIGANPAQVVLAVSLIHWTANVTQAIVEGGVAGLQVGSAWSWQRRREGRIAQFRYFFWCFAA